MPKISVKVFKGEYLQDLSVMGDLEPAGPSASAQLNAYLQENDVMPVTLATELTKLPADKPSIRRLMHTITVAVMPREDWETQQARIMAAGMRFKEAERLQHVE